MARVLFMGTPEFAVPSLQTLLAEGYDVVAVLTREDRPAGRGRRVDESPVKTAARASGLAVYQPRTLRDESVQAELAALSSDLIVVAAFGLILPQAVLDLPRRGCVNVHGSLLPRFRGAAPIAATILAGDPKAGVSIMLMDAGLDTGPVLWQAALPVAPDDTTSTLTPKLAALGAELLAETLPRWLAGLITPQLQEEEKASFAPRMGKDAGEIRWSEPAAIIERRVRAYNPWPSTYTYWRGQMLKVTCATVEDDAGPDLPPGTVMGTGQRAGVVTGRGVLWLGDVQLAGKRVLSIDAFLRGAPGFIGSMLPS